LFWGGIEALFQFLGIFDIIWLISMLKSVKNFKSSICEFKFSQVKKSYIGGTHRSRTDFLTFSDLQLLPRQILSPISDFLSI
jgi:hypothetical protein